MVVVVLVLAVAVVVVVVVVEVVVHAKKSLKPRALARWPMLTDIGSSI